MNKEEVEKRISHGLFLLQTAEKIGFGKGFTIGFGFGILAGIAICHLP